MYVHQQFSININDFTCSLSTELDEFVRLDICNITKRNYYYYANLSRLRKITSQYFKIPNSVISGIGYLYYLENKQWL